MQRKLTFTTTLHNLKREAKAKRAASSRRGSHSPSWLETMWEWAGRP